MVICLKRGADLHMAQLMPLPLMVSCFSKVQIAFTFLVPAHLCSPRQSVVKWLCVLSCCCCCVQLIWTARNCGEVGELTETAEVFISYLPLSHVAAQILDIFIPLMFAVTVYFAQPDALKVHWPECFLRHFVKHHFPYSLFFPTGLPTFILVIPLVSSDSETLICSVLRLSTHYLALAAAALQPLKSVTLSLYLSIPVPVPIPFVVISRPTTASRPSNPLNSSPLAPQIRLC